MSSPIVKEFFIVLTSITIVISKLPVVANFSDILPSYPLLLRLLQPNLVRYSRFVAVSTWLSSDDHYLVRWNIIQLVLGPHQ